MTHETPNGRREVRHSNAAVDRRDLLKLTGAGVAAFGMLSIATPRARAQFNGTWDKTFPKSDRVDQRKVTYLNRMGLPLVANLYIPKDIDRGATHPALVVGHPLGGVKEQASGLYAQSMAERGFITLAHDASYNGESGGEPKNICVPDAMVDDFSAGVDFLGTHPLVDRNRIGVIGVCASGGFSVAATEIDPRIRALATVSMYDSGDQRRNGVPRSMSEDDRRAYVKAVAEQRWAEAEGTPMAFGALPETLPENPHPILEEFWRYYKTPRGRHTRGPGATSLTSDGSLMHFRPLEHVEWISPRPVLFIAGSKAHSLYFSQEAYAKAREPKELYIVEGAIHTDLYDGVDIIPWDKLKGFFDSNLAA